MSRCRLGVVVNPIAGMGGRVGLHGTDGPALPAALSRGAERVASLRGRRALGRLRRRSGAHFTVFCAGGEMGAQLLTELGWPHEVVYQSPAVDTDAQDTRRAVLAMRSAGVDLVLFVGGDGTARDVVAAAGDVPVLGVPAGVKMHSGVFAISPEAAADTAARFMGDPAQEDVVVADIVDLVDSAFTLIGSARVPAASGGLQAAKTAATISDDVELAALGREVAGEMVPGALYLLGPGSTVAHVSAALGLPASQLGVDAIRDGRLLGTDFDERGLCNLLAAHQKAGLVLGVIGGQGFLLGRGNQQLSPAVIQTVGAQNIMILAGASKLATLVPPVLRIDVGDTTPVIPLSGYRQVRTGPGRSTVMRIVA